MPFDETHRIAYDLDGVIAREFRFVSRLFDYHPKFAAKLRDSRLTRPLYYPLARGMIITGRMEEDTLSTKRWLARFGIPHSSIVFNDVGYKYSQIVNYKVFWLRYYGIRTYVESDEDMIRDMQFQAPKVNMLNVETALKRGLIVRARDMR